MWRANQKAQADNKDGEETQPLCLLYSIYSSIHMSAVNDRCGSFLVKQENQCLIYFSTPR